MMTPSQIAHYRALWGDVRRVLRAQGVSSPECETRRHEIHVRALGKDKSSLRLNNKEFDLVKAAFLAISQPANVDAQLEDGDAKRCWWVIGELCAQIPGADDDYVQATVNRMQREGKLRPGTRDLQAAQLPPVELEKVIVALKLQVQREEERAAHKENARRSAALKPDAQLAFI